MATSKVSKSFKVRTFFARKFGRSSAELNSRSIPRRNLSTQETQIGTRTMYLTLVLLVVHKNVQSYETWCFISYFVHRYESIYREFLLMHLTHPHYSFCITTRISYSYSVEKNFLPFFS